VKQNKRDSGTSVKVDTAVIGAGAAGLICAIEAGKRKRSVVILEHNALTGKKIKISGGGRCNFTNISVDASKFVSNNPGFCVSALARYTSLDFISLVERNGIAYHEKEKGQLFCQGSSQQIIDMLEAECRAAGVHIVLNCDVAEITNETSFKILTNQGSYEAGSLVIASGGMSIPSLGATDFGYRVAKQFGLKVVPQKPGLVPLEWKDEDRACYSDLSGISLDSAIRCKNATFRGDMLFTHRGISGPAVLQISSYWNKGEEIIIDLFPSIDAFRIFKQNHQKKILFPSLLEKYLPKRFAERWCELHKMDKPLCETSTKDLQIIADGLKAWKIIPSRTEGFDKAEVTCGGIDTLELSSKTMESKKVRGLFFVGEVVDVTGWLGGYNFQWAWSSGFAAGQYA